MRRYVGLLIMGLVCALVAHAQDIHFSQFNVSPLLQNPANAGYFNCNYRFTAIYRNQWHAATVPYKTFAASYDMRFVNKHGKKDILGAGITFFNDKAGDGDLSNTNIGGAIAYHKNLDRFGINYFGAGLMLNYGAGSVDFFRLRFPDQYVSPGVTQNTLQTPFNSFNYIDASMGLEYNWIPEAKNNHVQVGAAIHHVNEPRKAFMIGSDARIPRKYVLHSSGQIRLDEHFELYPKVNFSLQGSEREIMVGSFGRMDLDKMKTDRYGVYLGLWMRLVGDVKKPIVSDALVIVTRLDVDKMSFAFSYDVNTSSLKTASSARGGPELSIIYIGCLPRSNGKAVYCPRF